MRRAGFATNDDSWADYLRLYLFRCSYVTKQRWMCRLSPGQRENFPFDMNATACSQVFRRNTIKL